MSDPSIPPPPTVDELAAQLATLTAALEDEKQKRRQRDSNQKARLELFDRLLGVQSAVDPPGTGRLVEHDSAIAALANLIVAVETDITELVQRQTDHAVTTAQLFAAHAAVDASLRADLAMVAERQTVDNAATDEALGGLTGELADVKDRLDAPAVNIADVLDPNETLSNPDVGILYARRRA